PATTHYRRDGHRGKAKGGQTRSRQRAPKPIANAAEWIDGFRLTFGRGAERLGEPRLWGSRGARVKEHSGALDNEINRGYQHYGARWRPALRPARRQRST